MAVLCPLFHDWSPQSLPAHQAAFTLPCLGPDRPGKLYLFVHSWLHHLLPCPWVPGHILCLPLFQVWFPQDRPGPGGPDWGTFAPPTTDICRAGQALGRQAGNTALPTIMAVLPRTRQALELQASKLWFFFHGLSATLSMTGFYSV